MSNTNLPKHLQHFADKTQAIPPKLDRWHPDANFATFDWGASGIWEFWSHEPRYAHSQCLPNDENESICGQHHTGIEHWGYVFADTYGKAEMSLVSREDAKLLHRWAASSQQLQAVPA